ncbi:ImmA/IrrE family metallo-endopeptidase [Rhizobium mongolense]|uniref:ImmA/IrrE family metallo-endopeptidase n=1 Tax=Rhizobium mongolense TaxID=57676 RepID=UPI0035583E31
MTYAARLSLVCAFILLACLLSYKWVGLQMNEDAGASRFARIVSACLQNRQARIPKFNNQDTVFLSNVNIIIKNGNLEQRETSLIDKSKPESFDVTLDEYIKFLLKNFLIKTDFEEKFQVNVFPSESSINVYFLTCDTTSILPPQAKCAYVGYFNSIVCNVKSVEEMFAAVDQYDRLYDVIGMNTSSNTMMRENSETLLGYAKSEIKKNQITWILGHELGHAILHRDLVGKAGIQLHFSYSYNKQEREADEFFAEKLSRSPALLAATGAGNSIGEFIEHEYRAILAQDESIDKKLILTRFVPTIIPIKIKLGLGAVPLIVRALNIQRAVQTAGMWEDTSGYYKIVEDNVTLIEPLQGVPLKEIVFWAATILGCVSVLFTLFSRRLK